MSTAAQLDQCRDPLAFADVYAEHAPRILRFLRTRMRDQTEAEDALHEVFLKAWHDLPIDLAPSGIQGWLFMIARTTAIDHARRQARQQPFEPSTLLALADRCQPAPPVGAHWISEPEVQTILIQLPRRQQEIIVLRYLMGTGHAETARILGCTEESVRKAHQRALQVLARALAGSQLAGERAPQRHSLTVVAPRRRLALGGFSLLPRLRVGTR